MASKNDNLVQQIDEATDAMEMVAINLEENMTDLEHAEITIGTHDGSFQCDESLACAMLKLLPRYRCARVVRSREPSVLASCTLVVDVGLEFDGSRHKYDHHQPSFQHTLHSLDPRLFWGKTKLSSAGLIYFYFGREVIATLLGVDEQEEVVQQVFRKVYTNMVEEVDASDNGVPITFGSTNFLAKSGLACRVADMNPTWVDEQADYDASFARAVELVTSEFVAKVEYFGKVWWPARAVVRRALVGRMAVHRSGRVVDVSHGGRGRLPWQGHLLAMEKEMANLPILLVVWYEEDNDEWRVRSVPTPGGHQFTHRLLLPAAWWGLGGAELEAVAGVQGAVFVHGQGFTARARTREAAMAMVEAVLATVDVWSAEDDHSKADRKVVARSGRGSGRQHLEHLRDSAAATRDAGRARPRLVLAPRSVAGGLEEAPRSPIFGGARPVVTRRL